MDETDNIKTKKRVGEITQWLRVFVFAGDWDLISSTHMVAPIFRVSNLQEHQAHM